MGANDNINTLHSILSKILGISAQEVTDQTSPDTVPRWDSYNGLMLVSELETQFNVNFTMDEVVAVKNVGDIKASLRKHGIDL
ncbi:acyl carrier protein [Candidatus Uhrbacteria bacterium]|nr:acyl carrier protein [Candidatus Uhrbacteria bacterium]